MSTGAEFKHLLPHVRASDPREFANMWQQAPLFLAVLEKSGLGAWYWEISSGRVNWSRTAKTVFGFAPNKDITESIDYLGLVHESDRAQVHEQLHAISAGTLQENTLRHRVIWPDGSTHWIELNTIFQHNGHAQPVVFGIVRDITAQQEQMQALIESEKRFSTLFHLSSESALLVRQSDAIITTVNHHFEQTFGWLSQQICGRTTTEANLWGDPLDRERIHKALQLSNAPLSQPVTLRHADGSLIEGVLTSHLIEIDKQTYTFSTFTEICERQRAELALRNSEDKFAKAFKHSPDAMVISQKHSGKLIQVNPGFERQFGWNSTEATFKTAAQLGLWQNPADRKKMLEAIEKHPLEAFEVQLCDKQKNPSTNLLFGDEIELNGHSCLLLTIRDITQRRSQEQALKHSQERLNLALDSANLGTWDWHIPSNTLHGSQRAAALHGLPDSGFDGCFADFFAHISEQDQQRFYQDHRALLASKKPTYQLTYRSKLSDGSVRHLECIAQLSRNTDGTPLRMTGVVMDVTDRTLREQTLAASEEKYSALFLSSPDPICVSLLSDDTILEVNTKFCETFGWQPNELIGIRSMGLYLWQSPEQRAKLEHKLVLNKELNNEIVPLITRAGRALTCVMSSRLITVNNQPYITTTYHDISDQKAAELALAASQEKFAKAFHSSPDAITITEAQSGRYIEVNEGFERLSGYNSDEIIGRTSLEIDIWENASERQRIIQQIKDHGSAVHMEMNCRHRNGKIIPAEISVEGIELNGTACLLITARDLSELKEAQAQIQHLAYHDALTNLPNRALLMDRLSQQISMLKRHKMRGALLFLDLDHFKHINDSLGHPVGDSVLKFATARLEASVRMEDTVARLGGDEFVVLLSGLEGDMTQVTDLVYRLADQLRAILAEPMLIDGHRLQVTPSIGIALIPDHGNSPADLLKRADIALYRAKDLGRDTVQMFQASMQEAVSERLRLENDLRMALHRAEFELHFQPQVDARTDKIIGAEALLRWNHPVLGQQSPALFIHILEESGLILEVGNWVLNEACHTCAALIADGLIEPENFSLCVNISPRQFRQKDFVERVQSCLQKNNLPLLKLEITEGIVIQHIDDAIAKMNKLIQNGVSFAMDDFGTGYSSLTYLKRLPIDVIKIDQTFVQDVISDPNNAEIIRAIIAMAQSLKLTLIAEGVEEQEQLDFLLNENCNLYQGYLFSKPVPFNEFRQLLIKSRKH